MADSIGVNSANRPVEINRGLYVGSLIWNRYEVDILRYCFVSRFVCYGAFSSVESLLSADTHSSVHTVLSSKNVLFISQ
jgi:hypothetical protein